MSGGSLPCIAGAIELPQACSVEKECEIVIIRILERWKMAVVIALSLLLAGLACVGSSRAQIKKEDVDFEVLATVTAVKGDTLWELAQKYYDDPLRWKIIMDLNRIPDERRIPIGTVIYIPIEDAKRIAKQVDEEIRERKIGIKEDSADLKKLQDEVASLKKKLQDCEAENKRLAKALKECRAKNKKLTQALKEKDAIIKEQEAMIAAKDATNKELRAMLEELKATVAKIGEGRAARSEKDMLIEDLESKIRRQRREIEELEEVRSKLRAKIEEAEKKTWVEKQPPKPVARKADPRARVAAVAIALVGSILWILSK